MARGQQDFGIYATKRVAASMSDVGEAVVRLGSIVSYDRRGDVIWLDDFSGGVTKWEKSGSGVDWAIEDVSGYSRTGFTLMQLTTGVAVGSYAAVVKRLAYPVLTNLGFECSFIGVENLEYIRWALSVGGLSSSYTAYVRYRVTEQDLQYMDSAGVWQTFATGLNLSTLASLLHIVKLVADFETNEYVKFMFNDMTYSLSGIALRPEAAATISHMGVGIYIVNAVAGNQSCLVDDVIVTQVEP